MLNKLFGSVSAEKVFYYLLVYEKGYATKISALIGLSLNSVQKQLIKFEEAGILVSFLEGKTRLFTWNPRYPFLLELKALIDKAFQYLPETEKTKYFQERTRPRRTGKPR
jgi:DNA-binding transcriptional ArsR family regulator